MSNNNDCGGGEGVAEGGEAESNEEVQGVYIKAFC